MQKTGGGTRVAAASPRLPPPTTHRTSTYWLAPLCTSSAAPLTSTLPKEAAAAVLRLSCADALGLVKLRPGPGAGAADRPRPDAEAAATARCAWLHGGGDDAGVTTAAASTRSGWQGGGQSCGGGSGGGAPAAAAQQPEGAAHPALQASTTIEGSHLATLRVARREEEARARRSILDLLWFGRTRVVGCLGLSTGLIRCQSRRERPVGGQARCGPAVLTVKCALRITNGPQLRSLRHISPAFALADICKPAREPWRPP